MTMKRAERISMILSVTEGIAKKIEGMDTLTPDPSSEILDAEGKTHGLLGEILEACDLPKHMGTKPNADSTVALAEALCLEIEQLPETVACPWNLMQVHSTSTPANKTDLLLAMYSFMTNLKDTKFNSGKRGRPPLMFTVSKK